MNTYTIFNRKPPTSRSTRLLIEKSPLNTKHV